MITEGIAEVIHRVKGGLDRRLTETAKVRRFELPGGQIITEDHPMIQLGHMPDKVHSVLEVKRRRFIDRDWTIVRILDPKGKQIENG